MAPELSPECCIIVNILLPQLLYVCARFPHSHLQRDILSSYSILKEWRPDPYDV